MGTGLAVPCPDERISPDNRAVAHLEGSKSPPRPRIAEGPWLKVSQNAGAFKLQLADAMNGDGDGSAASTAGEVSTKGESAIVEASAMASRRLAL